MFYEDQQIISSFESLIIDLRKDVTLKLNTHYLTNLVIDIDKLRQVS